MLFLGCKDTTIFANHQFYKHLQFVELTLNIQTMHFTKLQISELMRKHAEKENGLHDLMEIMLESIMVAERVEFLREDPQNKGNGYRLGHAYGQGRKLGFRIPRDRYGNFHPRILAILRDQE